MKRIVTLLLVCAVIGLVAGYLVFGKIGNEYIAISTLITGSENILERAARRIGGIEEMRRNILLMGVGGAVVGLVAALYAPRGRRRR
ncbi:MAG: hypothetical protein ACOC25_03625 [Alkalispirochaetaceae bacterium]